MTADRPPRDELRASTVPPLVGRETELQVLADALDCAASGSTAVVLVHGEPGIGKTRLLDEFAAAPAARDATLLRGTCSPGHETPYGLWAEAVGHYLNGRAPEQIEPDLGRGAAVLADLIPRLREWIPDLRPPTPLSAAESQLRLCDEVLRFLESLPAPRLLVLDDLHWAGPATLELMSHIARFATSTLIAGGYRGNELGFDDPLTRRLAEINRHRFCRYVMVPSLSAVHASELANRVGGRPLDAETVETIYRKSGGNPFFLIELARNLRDDERGRVNGRCEHLPQTIRAAVALRLASLSPPCRQMLEHAVVFTSAIAFPALRALTDLDEDHLLDLIDEVLAAELWVTLGRERYGFTHALVRQALHDAVSPGRRARLHRRLAHVLENANHPGEAESTAEIARQYHASSSLPGAQQGVSYALTAAGQAQKAHAPSEAAGVLQMALDLLPADAAPERTAFTGLFAVALAQASIVEEALPTLDRSVSLLQSANAPPSEIVDLICRAVSALKMAYSPDEAIRPLVDRGLALLGEARTIEWARLQLLKRDFELLPAGRTYSLRFKGVDPEAVTIARSLGGEADFARSIDIMAWLPMAEIETLAEKVGGFSDQAAKLRGLDMLAMSLSLRHGAPPTLNTICEQVELLATQFGSLATEAMAHVYRASILGARGQLRASVATFSDAEAIAERVPGSPIAHGAAWMHELTAQHLRPDWSQMARNCWQIATDREQVVLFSSGVAATAALASARRGASHEARERLAEIMPALRRHNPTDFVQSGAVGQAAEAIWTLRDPELAQALLPDALALLEAEAGDWYMTSNALTAARLRTILGQPKAALAHFAQARDRLGRVQQLPLLAIVDHDEAIARKLLRLPGASQLLAQATQSFARLDMQEWQGLAGTVSTASALPDGLTPREAQVLRLLAAGRRNKQIASDLVLSVFTVERHLANAYRKINVSNRAQAAAYVIEHDL